MTGRVSTIRPELVSTWSSVTAEENYIPKCCQIRVQLSVVFLCYDEIVAGLKTPVWLYRVVILGTDWVAVSTSGKARLTSAEGETSLDTSHSHGAGTTTVRKPGVTLDTEWTIQL